jgi:hypothetical protein
MKGKWRTARNNSTNQKKMLKNQLVYKILKKWSQIIPWYRLDMQAGRSI